MVWSQLWVPSSQAWRVGEAVGREVGPDELGVPVGATVGADELGDRVGWAIGSGVVGNTVGGVDGAGVAGAAVGAVLVGGTEGRRVGVAVAGEEVGGPVGSAVVGRADGACGELVQAVESARSNASEVIVNQGPWHALASILGLMLGSNQPKDGHRVPLGGALLEGAPVRQGHGRGCVERRGGSRVPCWGVRAGGIMLGCQGGALGPISSNVHSCVLLLNSRETTVSSKSDRT